MDNSRNMDRISICNWENDLRTSIGVTKISASFACLKTFYRDFRNNIYIYHRLAYLPLFYFNSLARSGDALLDLLISILQSCLKKPILQVFIFNLSVRARLFYVVRNLLTSSRYALWGGEKRVNRDLWKQVTGGNRKLATGNQVETRVLN